MNSLLEETEVTDIDLGDMACRFKHDHKSVPASCRTCLEEVRGLLVATCSPEAIYLCEAAMSAARTFIAAGKVTRCSGCRQPANTHWSVRPI